MTMSASTLKITRTIHSEQVLNACVTDSQQPSEGFEEDMDRGR